MTDGIREFLSLVLGIVFSVLMPALVSWLKQSSWPEWKKVGLALLVAVALGALTVLAKGEIDLQDLATAVTAIFTAATIIYRTWFRETRLNGILENKQVLP